MEGCCCCSADPEGVRGMATWRQTAVLAEIMEFGGEPGSRHGMTAIDHEHGSKPVRWGAQMEEFQHGREDRKQSHSLQQKSEISTGNGRGRRLAQKFE